MAVFYGGIKYTQQDKQRIQKEANTFRNIVADGNASGLNFFNRWRDGRKSHQGEKLEKLNLGKVTPDIARKINDAMGYLTTSTDFIITSDTVRHILNSHGNPDVEISRGNLPLEAKHIEMLTDVIKNPSRITKGMREGENGRRQGIVFEKQLNDGTIVYVQFDNTGRGTLEGRTLYIKKGTATSAVNATSANTFTPETTEPAVPFDTAAPFKTGSVPKKQLPSDASVFDNSIPLSFEESNMQDNQSATYSSIALDLGEEFNAYQSDLMLEYGATSAEELTAVLNDADYAEYIARSEEAEQRGLAEIADAHIEQAELQEFRRQKAQEAQIEAETDEAVQRAMKEAKGAPVKQFTVEEQSAILEVVSNVSRTVGSFLNSFHNLDFFRYFDFASKGNKEMPLTKSESRNTHFPTCKRNSPSSGSKSKRHQTYSEVYTMTMLSASTPCCERYTLRLKQPRRASSTATTRRRRIIKTAPIIGRGR